MLFDQGVPVPLKKHLSNSDVITLYEMGWSTIANGELLKKAEAEGFAVFVTTDKNLKYQQNIAVRSIAIVVLPTTNWQTLQKHTAKIAQEVSKVDSGGFVEIEL